MILSLNEIETACYRAALGAGLCHGLAEDASAIAARLVTARDDGLAIMLRALIFADRHRVAAPVFVCEDGAWRPRTGFLPSLMAGPAAADLRRAWPGARIDVGMADEPAVIAACLEPGHLARPAAAFTVAGQLWQDLTRLAARTYVPASEKSRRLGAGAGLHDND